MKKLLLSTIVLLSFSISLLIFDISCRKDVVGQTESTDLTLKSGKIVFVKYPISGPWECWVMNYDGTGKTLVNLQIPPEVTVYTQQFHISSDGKIIYFSGYTSTNSITTFLLCSVNVNGSNFKILHSGPESFDFN